MLCRLPSRVSFGVGPQSERLAFWQSVFIEDNWLSFFKRLHQKFLQWREEVNKPDFIMPQGINLHSDDELLPDFLSNVLVETVGFLQSIEAQGANLHKYADWWEHDGLHFGDGYIDFATLLLIVQSPSALLKAMPRGFGVFIGIAPLDFSWYLRFYIDAEARNGEEVFGRFDLTLREELMERYKAEVVRPLGMEMQEQEAGKYYQSIISD